jgi:hypothetical protein
MDEETSKAIEEALHIMQQQARQGAGADPAPVTAQAMPPLDEHPTEPPPQEPEPGNSDPGQGTRPSRARHWLGIAALVAGISSATALVVLVVLPLLQPTAIVTIIPAARTLQTTTTVQVPGRALPVVTLTQMRSVPTTGIGHQQAQAASGMVTLYNAAPYAQSIPAGTLLTGTDGIEIVTEQDATIPAGDLATNGQVSVLAQALEPGPQGNIKAGDLYGPCCRANVFVSNSAFRGGQDAHTFPQVTHRDLASVTAELSTLLSQNMQAALAAQLAPGEALALPTCQTTRSSDHQEGDEASAITVSMTETCRAWAYQRQEVAGHVRERLQAQAQRLGEGYRLSSDPHITILATSRISTTLHIQVNGQAQLAYQFSQGQLATITRTIAGMPKAEATAWLAQQPGVQAVSIALPGASTTLPQDASAIRCTILYTQG